jgi:hypothetical protein
VDALPLQPARHIDIDTDEGTRGKFADLVILDRDPLVDVANTLAIDAVVLGGRIRDGRTIDERWPEAGALPRRWNCDDCPPGTPDPCAPAL